MNNITGLSDSFYIGRWRFNEIKINDIDLYSDYIGKTRYPANLWVSNFAFLWASSQSNIRKKIWRIADDMLVTFTCSNTGRMDLTCLPFGEGNAQKVLNVLYKSLKYCNEWNNSAAGACVLEINSMQARFLKKDRTFDKYFILDSREGLEKHFSIQKLVALSGKEFIAVRRKINKFRRLCPDAIIRRYRPEDYRDVIRLGEEWRRTSGQKYDEILDEAFFPEIIKHCRKLDHLVLVVELEGSIIGMVSGGALPNGQSWWCLSKFLDNIDGLSEFLVVELAKYINKYNPEIKLMNAAYDSGPGGLRFFMDRFRPVLDLKRYKVYLRQ